MTTLRATVRQVNDLLQYVPFAELWGTAGLLADELPLDRAPRYPRPARRIGHWLRLAVADRALTNDDRTAVLVMSRTPWALGAAAAVGAAVLTPRSPRWQRRLVAGLVVVGVLGRHRVQEELELRRRLRELAPGALLIGDLVTIAPGAAVPWISEVLQTLDARGHAVTIAAILPGARRDAARARIYTRVLGFEIAARLESRGKTTTVLVREPPRA